MKLGLFLATLIGLAGASHISSAADASWAAVGALENGMSTSCGGGTVSTGPEWTSPAYGQVDIKGNTLTFTRQSAKKDSFTVDLKALQADGSGKVVGKDWKDREFYVTFEPGAGPRPFYVTTFIGHCRYLFTPKTSLLARPYRAASHSSTTFTTSPIAPRGRSPHLRRP